MDPRIPDKCQVGIWQRHVESLLIKNTAPTHCGPICKSLIFIYLYIERQSEDVTNNDDTRHKDKNKLPRGDEKMADVPPPHSLPLASAGEVLDESVVDLDYQFKEPEGTWELILDEIPTSTNPDKIFAHYLSLPGFVDGRSYTNIAANRAFLAFQDEQPYQHALALPHPIGIVFSLPDYDPTVFHGVFHRVTYAIAAVTGLTLANIKQAIIDHTKAKTTSLSINDQKLCVSMYADSEENWMKLLNVPIIKVQTAPNTLSFLRLIVSLAATSDST